MSEKPDNWVSHAKTLKIERLIDQQIVLRTKQLHTFIELQKAIRARNVRGQLRESDLAYIKHKIKKELK